MTSFYSQKKLDFGTFYDGTLPVIKTIEGCKDINKWIKKGEHYPVIKLPYFFCSTGIEIKVYQHVDTLEVQEAYPWQLIPKDEKFTLILRERVPKISLETGKMTKSYLVPKEVKAGDKVYIPQIIYSKSVTAYTNHHGGIQAEFNGKDLIFLEKPNRIKVYSH